MEHFITVRRNPGSSFESELIDGIIDSDLMKRFLGIGTLFKPQLPCGRALNLSLSLAADVEIPNQLRMKDQCECSGSCIGKRGTLFLFFRGAVLLNPKRSRWPLLNLRHVVEQLFCGPTHLAILAELGVLNPLRRCEALQVLHQVDGSV